MIAFRRAVRADVPAVLDMLRDDALGASRETANLATYLHAFDAMAGEAGSMLIVGEEAGRTVATYQLNVILGLSHRATRRAQVESVRVAADRRGQGIGAALMADAEVRARAAGCALMQLTTHRSRTRAHRFYDRLGYVASHVGYKCMLNEEADDAR